METSNNLSSALVNKLNTVKKTNATKKAINQITKNSNITNSIVKDYISLNTPASTTIYNNTVDNVISSLNLVQTIDDALEEMQDNLSYLQGVLNDINSSDNKNTDLSSLKDSANNIINNILNIYNNTEYNGVKVFSGIQSSSSQTVLDNNQNFIYSLGTQSDMNSQLSINAKFNSGILQGIQGLLGDEDFASKLKNIMDTIDIKRNEISETMQTLSNISQSYENNDSVLGNFAINISNLNSQITSNAIPTIKTVTNGLSSDLLLQFVNNQ